MNGRPSHPPPPPWSSSPALHPCISPTTHTPTACLGGALPLAAGLRRGRPPDGVGEVWPPRTGPAGGAAPAGRRRGLV